MRTQGERIKKLRKSKGVTQRELAERLGISEQAVSKWEKNLSNPSTKNLLQIAKIFGVSITYFYQSEESQSKKIVRGSGMASLRELYKIGRGPSSSHTIGPERACLRFKAEHPAESYRAVLYGSLSKTGKGHGTDYVIKETFLPQICEVEFDFDTDEQCQELVKITEKWHGYDNGRIKIDAGIYAEYTSNYKLWEGLGGFASEKGLGFQLHLAETRGEVDSCLDRTGLGPAELLDCHRVFAVPTTAAGCGVLSEEEMKMLGKKKVTAVAQPLNAAKAGQGTTPILDCVKAGMNVALGTGGAIECGNLDLFEVMRYAAASERGRAGDAAALPAPAVLMMATTCGARAQGRARECGMLKEGMDADIILVDFTAPHLMPCHNILSGLVFSAKGGDVAMTMVRGKILYQNGRFPTIDLNEVVTELTEYAIPRLFADPGKEEANV